MFGGAILPSELEGSLDSKRINSRRVISHGKYPAVSQKVGHPVISSCSASRIEANDSMRRKGEGSKNFRSSTLRIFLRSVAPNTPEERNPDLGRTPDPHSACGVILFLVRPSIRGDFGPYESDFSLLLMR